MKYLFTTLVSDDLGLLTRTLDQLLGKTLNGPFIHAECEALIELATDYGADVVVDAWNPFACIAARVLQQAYGGAYAAARLIEDLAPLS